MISSIRFRPGDEEALAHAFIKMTEKKVLKFETEKLEDPEQLIDENILALHFAYAGAQGDSGAVEILFNAPSGVRILYGNYAYGDLDLDAVINKFPMLEYPDTRRRNDSSYPFCGKPFSQFDWHHIYMGCMNHYYARTIINYKTSTFVDILRKKGQSWQIFEAVAWFCGANPVY